MDSELITVPGQSFRAARIAKNLSQAEVANALSVSTMTVSNWERGRVKKRHFHALMALEAKPAATYGRPVGAVQVFKTGAEVAAYRKTLEATQADVARVLGISVGTVARYETQGAPAVYWFALRGARADIVLAHNARRAVA